MRHVPEWMQPRKAPLTCDCAHVSITCTPSFSSPRRVGWGAAFLFYAADLPNQVVHSGAFTEERGGLNDRSLVSLANSSALASHLNGLSRGLWMCGWVARYEGSRLKAPCCGAPCMQSSLAAAATTAAAAACNKTRSGISIRSRMGLLQIQEGFHSTGPPTIRCRYRIGK
jgi:hypothetical protein